MPQRPREHRIEDESRAAFAQALGEDYLYRTEIPDYSIDGGVEEFKDDHASGLRYLVQLKATDATGEEALARSLPVETLQYYGALPLPVLLVRYVSDGGRLYARWVHALGISRRAAESQTTVTVRWRPEDALETNPGARLADEARSFLALRSATLPLPFAFGLHAALTLRGVAEAQLWIALQHQLGPRTDVVRLLRDPPAGAGRFIAEEDRLAIELASQVATDYDLGADYDPGSGGQQMATDLIALAAVAFARWGQADAASRIAHSHLAASSLSTVPGAALPLSSEMARTRRVRESLELADALDENPNAGQAAFMLTLPSLFNAKSLTDEESKLHQEVLQRRIERREARGDQVAAARECINLGNRYRYLADGPKAAVLYERAARRDPDYLNRQHYWHEYGGVLFFSGRFEEAANAYQRAVELGGDRMTELLRADSLMFAGRYRDALEEFRRLVANAGEVSRYAEYQLKQLLLGLLIDRFELEAQDRDSARALELVERIEDVDGVDAAKELMTQALCADALCGLAWWNLAHAYREEGDESTAGSLFVEAALCLGHDIEAWALGTVLTWFHGDLNLVPAILVTGQRLTGGHLVLRLSEMAAANLQGGDLQDFLTGVDRILDELGEKADDSFTLRAVEAGSEVSISRYPDATSAA